MAKSERLFEMLEYIREYPHLTVQDLSRLCNVSIRGVYRYLNTLNRAGIPVHFQEDGYRLPEEGVNLLRRFDVEDLQAIRKLLSIGISNSDSDELVQYGRRFLEMIDENLPGSRQVIPEGIEIVPEWVEPDHYGGTLTIGHSSKPDIINPILTYDSISVTLMNLIFSSLVRFDNSQKPVPDVARDWTVSKDGLVWTFFLRDDVRFHDGHPLTAHDVVFTYRSILDPYISSPIAKKYTPIEEIKAENDYIVRINLKYPFAPIIYWLSREIAPKHLLEGVNLRTTPFNHRPVGSGPFMLSEWAEDDTMVLEANRGYYHRRRPILDRLIFRSYPDRETALHAISRGEMDIALELAASDLLFVSRRGGFRIYSVLGASYYAIIFNLRDSVFRDIRVRKALDYAIDKELIIKNQLKGHSRVCTGPFSVNSWAYNHDVVSVPHDVEKARALLKQAGWCDSDGDGILDRDGKPFEFSLSVPDISDSLERIAVGIRAQLMKAGIMVKLVYKDDSNLSKASFQAMLARISAGFDPDYAYGLWHSESDDTNLTFYENKLVDGLLEQGRLTTDLEKRKAIYHKIHGIIHDEYPAVFLASGCEFIGSSYRFRSVDFSSTMHFLTTTKDWQIVSEEKEDASRKTDQKVSITLV